MLLTMPASTTPQGILARVGLGEEVSLKILCSEEYLVEDWPLLDYHTLRKPGTSAAIKKIKLITIF